jgi:F-type H+-transporting ATPase subunit alpha
MLNLNSFNYIASSDETRDEFDFFSLLLESGVGSNGASFAEAIFEDDSTESSDSNMTGVVLSFKDSVVTIAGLDGVQANELIYFAGGATGVALNLEYSIVKALVFGGSNSVRTSEVVRRSEVVMQVGVGSQVLGRIINPLGVAIDGLGDIEFEEFRAIEKKAPGVITRKKINEPVETGLKVVDSLVPIGRGQRELILGDRKTGKTTIAIDTILNQLETKRKFRAVISCVYVAVGKRMSEIVRISRLLRSQGVDRATALVVARASDPASLQFIAPYSACTMAEYFTYKGHHALIIYDDLTRHADAYRQISLLLRRPVGREAYPGDIFYLHSRLLERAVKLSAAFGGGSLTALPIVETIQGDVSAYIPTNVISITDGQIYLDLNRHQEGNRPAVDPGISVSRVGSSAQSKMMKRLAGSLKLELAQFREVEQFSKFGSELDAATRSLLFRGKLMVSMLTQGRNKPMSMFKQLMVFYLTSTEFFQNTVAADASIDLFDYLASLYLFLELSVLMLPSKIALEKQNVVMRELLDDLVRIHFSFYLNADRASLDLNDANTELAAISAKYGATIAEVLLLAGFIKNFVDAN